MLETKNVLYSKELLNLSQSNIVHSYPDRQIVLKEKFKHQLEKRKTNYVAHFSHSKSLTEPLMLLE